MFSLRRLFRLAPPDLSVELIRENPWNAIYLPLPSDPNKPLLDLAIIAADYCRSSERLVLDECRQSRDYLDPVPSFVEELIEKLEHSCECTHDKWKELLFLYHECCFHLMP